METVIATLELLNATLSYKFSLDGLEQAFEHCRVLPIPSLGLSLPFCQAIILFDMRSPLIGFYCLTKAHLLGICLIQVKNSTK
jgi:hypothetical protein